jgi:SnoaL-like protein
VPFSHHDYRLLEEATARAAIAALTVANSDADEADDLQAWLNTFTVEGSLTLDEQTPIVGHRALGQYFRERKRSGLQVAVNRVVQVDRVTAMQRCRVVSLVPGGTVQSVVDYDDALVYERGRWFFLSRTARARV